MLLPQGLEHRSVQRSVLNGFQKMMRLDILLPVQIGDGSCYLQYPVIGPGTESQLPDRACQKFFAGIIQFAILLDVSWPHEGIGVYTVAGVAIQLPLSCGDDALPDGRRGLGRLRRAQVLIPHGGHLDVEVDSIQDGSRDVAPVALHQVGAASTS